MTSDALAMPNRSERVLAVLALIAAGSLWGTGFIFGKIALRELSVSHMILYRFLFASVGIFYVVVRNPVRVARRDWGPVCIAAAFGVPILFLVQFAGLDRTTVSHAALVVGSQPVILALAAHMVFRERLDLLGWSAVIASSMGVAMIVLGGNHDAPGTTGPLPSLSGDLLVLLAVLGATVWMMLNKRLMQRYSATGMGALIIFVGIVQLVIWVLITHGLPPIAISRNAWLAVAAQGVLGSTCSILLWNWGFSRLHTGQAGVFLNVEPLIGAVFGVLLFHEVLGPFAIMGGTLIIGAAIVMSLHATRVTA